MDRDLARAERLVQRGRKLLDNWEDGADIDRALELFQQAVALAPNHAEAWRGLADALDEVEEFDKALEAYHRAIALGAESPALWRHLAEVASLGGEPQEAVSAAERAQTQAPDDADTLEICARVLIAVALHRRPANQTPADQRALLERAPAALEHMVVLQPVDALTDEAAWALRGQGALLIALGRLEEALTTFSHLGLASPMGRHKYLVANAAWDAACGRALALDRLGRPEEALTELEEGLAHNSSPQPVWSMFQASLLLRFGRPAEVLAVTDAILKVWQKNVPAMHLRAQALEALDRDGEAAAAWAAASEVQAALKQEAQALSQRREFVPDDPPLAALLP